MPRYIDAEKLIKKIFPVGLVDGDKYPINAKAVKCAIDSIPTADVVEVTRCENCKYFYKGNMVNRCTLTTLGLKMPHRDAWCCYGEKKES